jgi:protein LTV1
MPRRRWIPKESAQTFSLLYRSQNDPSIHDEASGERTLFQISGPSSSSQTTALPQPQKRSLHIEDLEDEVDLESMRENEGEAAEHGIFFDDTKYDYMQHLRDVGGGGGESYFVDAASIRVKGKGKGKQKSVKLEDALREVSLDKDEDVNSRYTGSVLNDALSTLSTSKNRTLEQQQDIPDEIAGFQPDMDPRLREVLEALEDEAYVDDKDEEDVFGELGLDGKHGELTLDEFEMTYDEDDEGWESDATEKAPEQPQQVPVPHLEPSTASDPSSTHDSSLPTAEEASAADGDWLANFSKFKREQQATRKARPAPADSIIAGSAVNDRAPTLYTLNGTPLRQKKRKGAQTNPSAYSMTSSSLARTEAQQLLDARFDTVERMYSLDEDDELDGDVDGGVSLASGMTGDSKASKMSQMSALSTTSFADKDAVRTDFDLMMDGFLGDWDKANPGGGKRKNGAKGKRGKNGNEKFGLAQLDEVRNELGRGRVRPGMKVV